ncbi:TIGR03619 family F420-dependent LLM class oxidoreductase [Paractinoplanes atraurantiacus]|uniref:Probable F420-dependent oxidoreductase, Rv2161c family n=1 Tax=Paractinoplanes atraurantiacus TaxID=1036182 RepID=A0A285HSZ0_9ACTN|nr:TIGR03619 family F420-dependent LLM class oxidoreductase [Actinoplanes atraurantiacus]SNY38797.1 probable F420-dependent oxidoreductase, Rv2161c family [Actinoplanes atraurantiacus]
MELGMALPTSGPLASKANILRVAREAEQLGYAALWTYERLLRPLAPLMPGADGELVRIPEDYRLTYDPIETLSFVSAVTERIKLGTSIVDALFHPPVVLARRFATLDQFSEGRVIAGLGQGWMPQEFATANVPLKRRGAGLDEVVEAMRACWGPDPVEYEGRFYQIEASEVNPKPVQAHVPIIIGAATPAGQLRAARIADGVNPNAFSYEQLTEAARTFREAAREHGRDATTLTVTARANVPITADPLGGARPFLGGSPHEIADDLKRLEGTGVDHVLFYNLAPDGIDSHLRLIAELKSLMG